MNCSMNSVVTKGGFRFCIRKDCRVEKAMIFLAGKPLTTNIALLLWIIVVGFAATFSIFLPQPCLKKSDIRVPLGFSFFAT